MTGTLDQLMRPNPIYELLTPEGKREYSQRKLSEWLAEREAKRRDKEFEKYVKADRERRNEEIRRQVREGARPIWALTGLGS